MTEKVVFQRSPRKPSLTLFYPGPHLDQGQLAASSRRQERFPDNPRRKEPTAKITFVLLFLKKIPRRRSSITNDRGKKNRLTSFLRMNTIIGGLDGELVEP
jgi:hypothetical protein